MGTDARLFEIERHDDTLILTPLQNLGEFRMEDSHEETEAILAACEDNQIRILLIDLQRTQFLQSTGLGFFGTLRQKIREHEGTAALCGLSGQEEEALELTHLNRLWPIFNSREEALDALKGRA